MTTPTTDNTIFHGLTREQANKIRSGHGAFYRYLKGICDLRRDPPRPSIWPANHQPPAHLRRETFHITLGEIADATRAEGLSTEEDTFPTEWEGLPLPEFIALTTNPPRTADPDATTNNFYRAFCGLCREFAREAVIQESRSIQALALLPNYKVRISVRLIKNLADYRIFQHHKGTTEKLDK